jgi:hypothetical protein
VVSEGKGPSLCRRKEARSFSALNIILDTLSGLNLRDWEAEGKADQGETSSKAAAKYSKEKDRVAEPD